MSDTQDLTEQKQQQSSTALALSSVLSAAAERINVSSPHDERRRRLREEEERQREAINRNLALVGEAVQLWDGHDLPSHPDLRDALVALAAKYVIEEGSRVDLYIARIAEEALRRLGHPRVIEAYLADTEFLGDQELYDGKFGCSALSVPGILASQHPATREVNALRLNDAILAARVRARAEEQQKLAEQQQAEEKRKADEAEKAAEAAKAEAVLVSAQRFREVAISEWLKLEPERWLTGNGDVWAAGLAKYCRGYEEGNADAFYSRKLTRADAVRLGVLDAYNKRLAAARERKKAVRLAALISSRIVKVLGGEDLYAGVVSEMIDVDEAARTVLCELLLPGWIEHDPDLYEVDEESPLGVSQYREIGRTRKALDERVADNQKKLHRITRGVPGGLVCKVFYSDDGITCTCTIGPWSLMAFGAVRAEGDE